ncbi:MAG: hypothetical protein PVI22_16890 [Lysobacterales bacterium]
MRVCVSTVPARRLLATLLAWCLSSSAFAQTVPDVTIQVLDVNAGSGFGNPSDPIVWSGDLYFSADDGFPCSGGAGGTQLGEYGRELFSGGIGTGPYLIKDINTQTSGNCDGVDNTLQDHAAGTSNYLIFRARSNPGSSSSVGFEPWRTDGQTGNADLVTDIASGGDDSNPRNMVSVLGGSYVAFNAWTYSSGEEPWITDGSAAGTAQLAEIAAAGDASNPRSFTPLSNDSFLFVASDQAALGEELYVSDGSGASLVEDINSDPGSDSHIQFLTPFKGKDLAVFIAEDPVAGREPWVTDGTAAGTFRLADINPGSADSNTQTDDGYNKCFTQVGDLMFFAADDGTTGRELWVTDGTPAGTRFVKEIYDGPGGGYSGQAAAFNGLLYFAAPGIGLWSSDGTTDGTQPVIATGFSTGLQEFAVVGDLLYFAVGTTLWVSDGTAGGTVQVDGPTFTVGPRALTAVGAAFLAFVARSADYGQEMFIAYAGPETLGPVTGIGFAPVPIGTYQDGTLTATANDANTGGSNIASAEYQLDGGLWSAMEALDGAYDSVTETGIQSVSFATVGTHQACVRSSDVLGNVGAPACMDIEVVAGDSTPPILTVVDVQPNPVTVGEAAVLSLNASDETTGNSQIILLEYQVDGADWQSISQPLDGAYDEVAEEAEVELSFGTAGMHSVCGRATDDANNVSNPGCVEVEVQELPPEICDNGIDDNGNGLVDQDDFQCPVGLEVICLHDPIYPAGGFQTVSIAAEAIDKDGNPVNAEDLSIYVGDFETPALSSTPDANGNNSVLGYSFSMGSALFYKCRATRGSEVADSGPVFSYPGPLSPVTPVPIVMHQDYKHAIDVVFFADDDEFDSETDPDFIDDVWLLIHDGYFKIPFFVSAQAHFNFWIATDPANASPDPDNKDDFGNLLCFRELPDHYNRRYRFADVSGIVHESNCRDHAGSPGNFTVEVDPQRLEVVAHESGHRPFGLADEYCCDGGYFSKIKFPNLFREENGCRDGASNRGFDPDDCRSLTEKSTGKDWWLFEPDYSTSTTCSSQPGDLMQQTGCIPDPATTGVIDRYRVGPSEVDRMLWYLNKCSDGKC